MRSGGLSFSMSLSGEPSIQASGSSMRFPNDPYKHEEKNDVALICFGSMDAKKA